MHWIDLITNITSLAAAVINLAATQTRPRPGGYRRQRHREPPADLPPDDPA